ESLWRRAWTWAVPAATLALAALIAVNLLRVLSPQPIGPLAELLSGLVSAARTATLVGIAGFVFGVVALVRLRRQREVRRLPIVTSPLLAVALGATAIVIGGLHWYAWGGAGDVENLSMPARAALGEAPHIARIRDATVVLLAPDADGDARSLAM